MNPLHQNTNKQTTQASMPGGFDQTSQQGYNPALNPSTDPMNQQGGLQQGGLHQDGLHQGGFPQGGYFPQDGIQQSGHLPQGGIQQGGHLPQGGLQQGGHLPQGGLQQGGLQQGGLQHGALPQGGLHHDNLNQENLRQNEINQADIHQRGLHAHNPRNTDMGLSHDQQLGTHHNQGGMHAPLGHHTNKGAGGVLSSTNYRNNDELSEPSSTTATHGSVESRKDYENVSATKGIKDTLAGSLQKIAGVVTGNDERRVKGEARAQEGKVQINAAKSQQAGRNVNAYDGHGRGDLQGTHVNDIKELDQPVGGGTYGAGTVPPTGHGRGGLENREVGNDSVFANANTGKAAGGGYGRGGLEGMASREE